MTLDATYDPTFYGNIRSGCQSSAAAVVPYVYDLIRPRSVLDLGCGEGWWGGAFGELGCATVGVDGSGSPEINSVRESLLGEFVSLDIATERLPESWIFDLAVCLEVAEHLPPDRARPLIEDLCNTAPVILFSAAIPGQTGAGHINCQWPDYWGELFAEHGYCLSGDIRWRFWEDETIEPWYRQNLCLAAPDHTIGGWNFGSAKNVVHPAIWATR